MREGGDTHAVVGSVRDGRPGKHLVLIRRPNLPPLRCGATGALHIVVEPGDDVPARRTLEICALLLSDVIFQLVL